MDGWMGKWIGRCMDVWMAKRILKWPDRGSVRNDEVNGN